MEKESDPAWFFTNERLGDFLLKLDSQRVRSVFSIAGGGDFAFNCLSDFRNISKVDLCDIRPLAGVTVDLKKALIKECHLKR